jgi:hypothetical protein
MVVLAAIAFLAVVALPLLASNKSRSEQMSCLSNLQQIGRAVHLWGNDHADRTPWFTPLTEGGTRETLGMGNLLRYNAYYQMGWLSNELVTPKMLVCPSDLDVGGPRRMASNFSALDPQGGFFTIGYRDSSLSYFVGLHADFGSPRSVLSGDRNIRWDALNSPCFLGVPAEMISYNLGKASALWTNAIHGPTGNLLYIDGAAEELSITGFQRAMGIPFESDNGSHHILAPP